LQFELLKQKFVLKTKNVQAGAGTQNFQEKVEFKAKESSIIKGNPGV
jgi:hypothetical protein